MAKGNNSLVATRKALAKKLSTGSKDPIVKVVDFSNDDVPKYLKHLKDLKTRPSKIRVTTRRCAV